MARRCGYLHAGLDWFWLTSLVTLVLLMWKWMGLFLRKNRLFRCWGWLSLLSFIGALILCLLLKLPPRKLESWFYEVLWSFIHPCMVYCCHIWAGANSCYLELLDKLQKGVCRIFGLSLATSLEPLAHRQNVAFLSLFCRCLEDVHLKWLNWFHFLSVEGSLLIILADCMIFLSPFLDVTRMSMSTVSFVAQLDSGILCL